MYFLLFEYLFNLNKLKKHPVVGLRTGSQQWFPIGGLVYRVDVLVVFVQPSSLHHLFDAWQACPLGPTPQRVDKVEQLRIFFKPIPTAKKPELLFEIDNPLVWYLILDVIVVLVS